MREYVTRAELRAFASNMMTEERATLRKSASTRSAENSTFLSHSSKDDELVDGAIKVLSNHGAQVYIDKVDPAMPPYTNAQTAATLKLRVRQSKKFVLLASENSKESKWVPWELGVADGYKAIENIALFPAVEERNKTTWTSWEYLGLYRRILWGTINGYDKPGWKVVDEATSTASWLRDWLNS